MTLIRLLPLVAAFALPTGASAADAPVRQAPAPASPCLQAVQDPSHPARRPNRDDVDVDGGGACALQDGRVAKGSRGNGGSSPGGLFGTDGADPLRHRFGDASDEHGLRSARRVTTIDVTPDEQRLAADGRPWRGLNDAFRPDPGFVAGTWSRHGAPLGDGVWNGAATGAPYAVVHAPRDVSSAFPLSGGGPLTSRAGGRMTDAGSTGPAFTAPAPVPEPGAWTMLAIGLAVLGLVPRRRFARNA
jgi:hypothetical protein